MIFNNSYFSLNIKKNFEKNEENKDFSDSFDKTNKKCIGINLTLSNIQNNNNKKQLKTTNANSQTNIIFKPFQEQCESLNKNNTHSQYIT